MVFHLHRDMEQFLETSLNDLYASAVEAFPNTTKRQYATQPIIIEEIRWMPFVGMKTLFVKAEARNEDRHYNPIILFKNVNYGGTGVKLRASDGLDYQFGRLSLESTDVLLRCNCNDFKWRFNYYNWVDKSLYGTKRSKYESLGGPPANPKHLPGMCKHLMKTTHVLMDAGIF